MNITIGDTTFDQVHYDEEADVLYLHAGGPERAVEFDESPEGHALRFDANGQLVGITIVNARSRVESREPIVVTVPDQITIDPSMLAEAVQPAA
ncbi:MAG TPA: DUF2283 domain-containing protein [Acidimicrobiia bacterium]|nr:DUF2283 domain-containing protein [Acidimicrobiia bacterium]